MNATLPLWLLLWRERAPLTGSSRQNVKTIAKRIYSIPQLIRQVVTQGTMRLKGADINTTATFGRVEVNGRLVRLSVGLESHIGKVHLSLHDKITIGNYVVINDGARLLTGSHDAHASTWPLITKPIIINDYVWIAENAIILPGVIIGRGAVIGAGAVVAKNVPELAIVIGNPARVLEKCRCELLNYSPVRGVALFQAWLGPMK